LPRLLLAGSALALVLGGGYIAVAGNPFARTSSAPTYQTAAVGAGTLQVTVGATGPITNPTSVPVSFKSAGKPAGRRPA
jgi:multidrug efflux pump subunit AcrA (membrane-fusion protein)